MVHTNSSVKTFFCRSGPQVRVIILSAALACGWVRFSVSVRVSVRVRVRVMVRVRVRFSVRVRVTVRVGVRVRVRVSGARVGLWLLLCKCCEFGRGVCYLSVYAL